MNHAEKCPVCNGTGKISTGNSSTAGPVEEVCHGCGGKGWVTVEDSWGYYSPSTLTPFYPADYIVGIV